jgi:DNA-binding NtrC family response regulator
MVARRYVSQTAGEDIHVLELNGGNQARTAKQLGIGSATLYRKLKKYGRAAYEGGRAASPTKPRGE